MTYDELPHPEVGRLDELQACVNHLAAELADVTAALTVVMASLEVSGGPEGTDQTSGPVYKTLSDWVEQHFCVVFARNIGGNTRWCPRWWEHPEALVRLEGLWRSWETLRLDPNLGIVTWLTSYLDPQLAILLSGPGPFAQCSPDRHMRSQRLPTSCDISQRSPQRLPPSTQGSWPRGTPR